MEQIILNKNEEMEVHGINCKHYLNITNNPKHKNLFIEYMGKKIDLEWIYALIEMYQKQINKKISR